MTDIRHTLRFPSSHTSACRLQEEGDNITPNEQAYDDPGPQKQAVLGVQPGSDTGQNDIVLSEESAGREEDELSCKRLFFESETDMQKDRKLGEERTMVIAIYKPSESG